MHTQLLNPPRRSVTRPRALVLILLVLLLTLACLSNTPSSPGASPGTSVAPTLPAVGPTSLPAVDKAEWKDLAYASASPAEKLDLYRPAGAPPFPLIVYVHGGGFRTGDKGEPVNRGLAKMALSRGYAFATLNYRLSGEAIFPAGIQDVKTAVRWLRAHAGDYGLDSNRFAAWGDSAGANLASLLGTSCSVPDLEGADLGSSGVSSCVQAVIDFYGPNDFLQMDQEFAGTACAANHNKPNSAESQYVGGPIQTKATVAESANPITYVSADDPAFFIQHGTADCTVPPQQSQLLNDALMPVIGAQNVSLNHIQGAGHGDKQFFAPSNLSLVMDFLDQHLK